MREFREKGVEFILEVLNCFNYLEDLIGLMELFRIIDDEFLVWDDDVDF